MTRICPACRQPTNLLDEIELLKRRNIRDHERLERLKHKIGMLETLLNATEVMWAKFGKEVN